MNIQAVSRRSFLRGTGAAVTGSLALQYANGTALAQTETDKDYQSFEDLYREKWTWDKVVHGTHGTNCTGHCAFNVYVKNGVVWREEQQGQYGNQGGEDVPDYGPRGCQKGLRHSKYMYGTQRVLYPMKRVGERGEGKWERLTWDQALTEVADKFIDHATTSGVDSISYEIGTQMVMKRGSWASLARFGNITGVSVPEAYAGVGDLPIGMYMTTGVPILGDSMAAIYKSKACLIWFCNPAVTRIPDAHFFWEAKYNGTKVVAISPEFSATAMHANRWLNPRAGTDTALALAMSQVVIADGSYDADYIREQTDLPFLVRTDNGKFLRGTDMATPPEAEVPDHVFYIWDESTGAAVQAPGTGKQPMNMEVPGIVHEDNAIVLGDIVPALEGTFTVETKDGPVEVTTVFEKTKTHLENYTPEKASEITGVGAEAIRTVAREFAGVKPGMIFTGYNACKNLHGDMVLRSFLLLLSLTGNIGPEGAGLQLTNIPGEGGTFAYAFADVGPALKIKTGATWDYETANMKELNAEVYGQELADEIDSHYQEAMQNQWIPPQAPLGWKMGFFAGVNSANWRASGIRWRETAFGQLETIVSAVPDMSVTAMHADYVFPIAHHYERNDMIHEGRTPYLHTLNEAVPPLGEAVDDWTWLKRLCEAIQTKAIERGVEPLPDNFMGNPITRDLTKVHDLFTMGGTLSQTKDLLDFLLQTTPGYPRIPFDDIAKNGIIRMAGSDGVIYDETSPFSSALISTYKNKRAYQTLTGRQQYYFDHDWFLKFDEALPDHRDPLTNDGYPLQLTMGHARHGIHSMWRDDSLMVALQRGEPDIYVSPVDAAERGVEDGDKIRVFSPMGEMIIQAHVTSAMKPGMMFMYHGWDPMMFKNRQNFGAVIPTAGLLKPTNMVGGYGHLNYQPFAWQANQTYKDFTCNFEKYVEGEAPAMQDAG